MNCKYFIICLKKYQNPNHTTYIGNYIANKGMRGAIENSALVVKES